MKVKPLVLSQHIKQMITQKNIHIFPTQTFSFGYEIRNISQTTIVEQHGYVVFLMSKQVSKIIGWRWWVIKLGDIKKNK
jgi:hypothetical protein